jgi:hypothetical protein
MAIVVAVVSLAARDNLTPFVLELEKCIWSNARRMAESFPQWGDSCMPPTSKVDAQAKLYEETLAPIRNKYGYQAALWCAVYSLGMTGAEYDPNDTQPNNPNFSDWYAKLLCPWNLNQCGASELSDSEQEGVPVCPFEDIGNEWKCAPNQHPQYPIWPADVYVKDEADRRTMSCALCGRLEKTFPGGPPVGAPAKVGRAAGMEYSLAGVPEARRHLFTNNWDLHAFGAWIANDAAHHKHAWPRTVGEIVRSINVWRASNGEEVLRRRVAILESYQRLGRRHVMGKGCGTWCCAMSSGSCVEGRMHDKIQAQGHARPLFSRFHSPGRRCHGNAIVPPHCCTCIHVLCALSLLVRAGSAC